LVLGGEADGTVPVGVLWVALGLGEKDLALLTTAAIATHALTVAAAAFFNVTYMALDCSDRAPSDHLENLRRSHFFFRRG